MPDRLNDYQQRVLDRLYAPDAPHGLIAYHSTGSGKTYTALAAMDKALGKGDRGLWIAPASLTGNVDAELKKHNIQPKGDIDVYSYEKARRLGEELGKRKYKMAVFDEAHRLRNLNTGLVSSLKPVIGNSDKVLMLSGTAGYNHPSDVLGLIGLMDPEVAKKYPSSKKEFEDRYVDDATWKLKNKGELSRVLNRYVDAYQTPKNAADFPTVSRKVISTEMSPEQARVYSYMEKNLPLHLRKQVERNLPMGTKDAAALNMFASGIRQASVSASHHNPKIDPADSSKLRAAAEHMLEASKKPGFRGVAYSNFREAGLNPYAEVLKRKGLEPLVYTGGLNKKQKKELVDRYNAPGKDPRVLLVSSSGAEGLDLKNTRLLQVLEPHFNRSKIQQVEGRGARFRSHADLPPEERNMLIEEYRSTLPRRGLLQKLHLKGPDTAIDSYLSDLSEKKNRLNEEMRGLIAS